MSFFMTDYHNNKLATLAVQAYFVSTNVKLDRKRRADCIEFLHELTPQSVELNFEGHKFSIPLVIFNVVGIIRAKSVKAAHDELIRFLPELKNTDWVWGAINSDLFKIDKPHPQW